MDIVEENIVSIIYSSNYAIEIGENSKLKEKAIDQLDLYARVSQAGGESDEDFENLDSEVEPDSKDMATLYLTLLHTFVYMINYYLFAPTANLYTEALGFSKSMSGALMAMTPIASIIFAFFLSWWSNYSFKSPLLFGCVMIILGDLFYAVAYDFNSITLLLIGRFLFGIGGARAIN